MTNYKEKYNRLKIEKDILKKELKNKNSKLLEDKKDYKYLIKAQNIIQEVTQQTQNQIKFFITDIVNMALKSIPFAENPGEFQIEFVTRRNQTECDLYFLKDDYKMMNLLLSQGGGILSITSFALLLACWSLQEKRNNVLIFDEPFTGINDPDNSLDLMFYIGEMIKELSRLLNIQIIIVGNNGNFDNIADNLIEIK